VKDCLILDNSLIRGMVLAVKLLNLQDFISRKDALKLHQ